MTIETIPPLRSLTSCSETPIRNLARAILRPMFISGDKMIEYKHLDKSLTELNYLIDQNSLLAIVTNHTSHSDILAGIRLVQAIRSRSPQIGNFHIPVAASLARGQQGLIAQLFYSEGTLPLLAQQNITPLALVTENDQRKRHLKPSYNETKQINLAVAKEQSAFLVFAEGSVEGGRYDTFGNVKGMQQVTNPFLPYIFQKAHEAGKKVIVLPVGIDGTNRMISAESLFLTQHSISALIEDWVLNKPATLARVCVGSPFVYPYDPKENLMHHKDKVNDTVMSSIASLLPPQLRGYYSPATREYQKDMKVYREYKPFLAAPWRALFHPDSLF